MQIETINGAVLLIEIPPTPINLVESCGDSREPTIIPIKDIKESSLKEIGKIWSDNLIDASKELRREQYNKK